MLQAPRPSAIDDVQGRLSPLLKYCLAGVGGMAGWHYARQTSNPIPFSYIIGGAAVGFCLIAGLFAGLRLAKMLAVAGVLLLVVNYALLVPFGYGDHLAGWLGQGRAALRRLDPSRIAGRWGKSVEIRPPRR